MQLLGSHNSRYFVAASGDEIQLFQAPPGLSCEATRRCQQIWQHRLDAFSLQLVSVSDTGEVILCGPQGITSLSASKGQDVAASPLWSEAILEGVPASSTGQLLCWHSASTAEPGKSILRFLKTATATRNHVFHILDRSNRVPKELHSFQTQGEEAVAWGTSPSFRFLALTYPYKKGLKVRLINLKVDTDAKEYELAQGRPFGIVVNDEGIAVVGLRNQDDRICFFMGGRLRTPLVANCDYQLCHVSKDWLMLRFEGAHQLVCHPMTGALRRDMTQTEPAQSGEIVDLASKGIERDVVLHVDELGNVFALRYADAAVELVPVRILQDAPFQLEAAASEEAPAPPPISPEDSLLAYLQTPPAPSLSDEMMPHVSPQIRGLPTLTDGRPVPQVPVVDPWPMEPADPATVSDTPKKAKLPSWMAPSPSPPQWKTSELMPGERLGHYEIINTIGKGGMGRVYRALDTRLLREVAVKVMLDDGTVEKAIDRFLVEARAVARISHPGVVKIYEVVTEPLPYIAMELIDGVPLNSIPHHEIKPARALALVRQVLEALQAVHDAGVTHRDLKQGNIMVCRQDHVVVMDFGLAKLADSDLRLTQTGTLCGTPGCMAPEQLQPDFGPIDGQTDIFAMGGILYELVCGVPPFTGNTVPVVLMGILLRDPRPPRELRATLSEQLSQAILKALQKEKEHRFKNCAEFLQALEGLTG